MPWTKKEYPDSMKNLPPAVRNKAIEIGNSMLLKRPLDAGYVVAMAISRAREWAVDNGKRPDRARKRNLVNTSFNFKP